MRCVRWRRASVIKFAWCGARGAHGKSERRAAGCRAQGAFSPFRIRNFRVVYAHGLVHIEADGRRSPALRKVEGRRGVRRGRMDSSRGASGTGSPRKPVCDARADPRSAGARALVALGAVGAGATAQGLADAPKGGLPRGQACHSDLLCRQRTTRGGVREKNQARAAPVRSPRVCVCRAPQHVAAAEHFRRSRVGPFFLTGLASQADLATGPQE